MKTPAYPMKVTIRVLPNGKYTSQVSFVSSNGVVYRSLTRPSDETPLQDAIALALGKASGREEAIQEMRGED